MVSKTVAINLPTGMHARPASALVACVKKYKSKVTLKYGEKQANCASILNLLALGLKGGTEVELSADGEDEALAIVEIADFISKLED